MTRNGMKRLDEQMKIAKVILHALDDSPKRLSDIFKIIFPTTCITWARYFRILKWMESKGQIEKVRIGRKHGYRVTDKGRAFLTGA